MKQSPNKRTLVATMIGLLLLATASVGVVGAQDILYYVHRWTANGSAGGISTGPTYIVQGTLGQQSVVSSRGLTHTITGGIWRGVSIVAPSPPTSSTLHLPLVVRHWPPIHHLDDAPDDCPGYGPVGLTPHAYLEDFDHESDYDWFLLHAAAGVTYIIEASQLESRSDTTLELYGQNCTTLLDQNDDIHYPDNIASRIVWTAPASGDYHLKVRHYDWSVYGDDTGYTFSVREVQQ